ncbi:hypothetical protein Goari_012185, partial [Gossypium aridum]|nr:hypothetical protein [Gossypium aridum]
MSDPFAWLMEECKMYSEDSGLQRCSYSNPSDCVSGSPDMPDAPLGSTAVATFPPPKSPEDPLPNDQPNLPTPPEFSSTPTCDDNCNDDRRIEKSDEKGSNSSAMKGVNERKRALPSWAYQKVEDDGAVDEKLKGSESELPSSLAKGKVAEDLEVNERKLPSLANGSGVDNEKADQEMVANGRNSVHSGMCSNGLSENVVEFTILDVLRHLGNDDDNELRLSTLSILEFSARKQMEGKRLEYSEGNCMKAIFVA